MITMQALELPKSQILQGNEAIDALNEYISELHQYNGEDLTKTQTNALIKLAKGLISTIENETSSADRMKEPNLMTQVRWTLSRLLQHSSEDLSSTSPNGRASDTSIASIPLGTLQHRIK
jgi:hypothetical protein